MFSFVFHNVSDHFLCSVCDSECVRSLLMFSLCVSECVRSLSMFSFCFRMCQVTFYVQFVIQNVSDHS